MLMRPDFGRGFAEEFWSPGRELARLQREMNDLLTRWSTWPQLRMAPSFPAMNLWTSDEAAIVTAELPGFDPDEIDISVEDRTLTVTGSRAPEEIAEDATIHRQERSYGRFSRALRLPFEVEVDQVEATFTNGVLHISLPRSEQDRPRKITVKTG
ncbi:MAG: Hsp20/alpha crystallin family protein [Anaerolineae bacterium]